MKKLFFKIKLLKIFSNSKKKLFEKFIFRFRFYKKTYYKFFLQLINKYADSEVEKADV